MKKNLTELVLILDRSGSMHGLEADTIGGFNAMIEKQRKQEGEVNVTTILFDDQQDMIHDRFPIAAVRPLTQKEYYVRGCTALLDAVGTAIDKMVNVQRHLPGEMQAEKVIFVITTDGKENASKRYDYRKIHSMIRYEQEKYGWEFIFLGANIDAVGEAKRFGIRKERAVRYNNDSEGVAMNYRVLGDTLCEMRAAASMSDVDESWKEEIERDYETRGKGSL